MSLIITDTRPQAALVLADGEVFLGRGFGARGSVTAEVVFNTAMTGYQEIVTDPSYTGQIVTLTYPHIGNVGVNAQDEESGSVCAAGLVIRTESPVVSNFRSEQSLSEYLQKAGVVGICDIDTRKLVRILRTKGAQAGTIVTAAGDKLTEEELAALRRGRNISSIKPPKNGTMQDYRRATGLECLFGYLYLKGEIQRINELFLMIEEHLEQGE